MSNQATASRAPAGGPGSTFGAPISPVGVIALAALLGLPTLYFLVDRAHFLTSFTEASYSPYLWAKRYAMLPHMIGGTAALLLGAVQVWLGVTGRTGILHRRIGTAYVWAVGVGTVGAIYMSWVVPGHFAYASGLFSNAIVWAVATGMAVWAIRNGNVELHRDWMMRSYVIALAFTAARVMLPLFRAFVEVPRDPPADDIQAATAWACWIVPLFVLEVAFGWRALRAGRASGRTRV